MKLHRNIALGIVAGLESSLFEKRPATEVIKKLLKSNRGWGSRDRRIIAQVFYDVIRQKRLFQALAGTENSNNDLWSLVACWTVLNNFTLPDWEEFKAVNTDSIKSKVSVLIQQRKYKYSIPDWLDKMGMAAFGEAAWEKEIASLNTPAAMIVRVNTLKTSVEKLKDTLKKKYQIITHNIPDYPNALIFEKKQSLHDIKEYREGFFEVQDANSQKVAPWLKAQSGKYYIDACAGAGGKSLHLANLTEDNAQILALDIYPAKLDELRKRCYRNGIQSVQTTSVENETVLNGIEKMADGVLIDAPCSGLGVLKRNPDAKWNITPERLEEILDVQKNILQTYAPMVKKRGTLVYATCSILPLENQLQVSHFLGSELGDLFELEKEHTYFSHETGFDGFYCARMIRKM
ncbi:MAG: RsmB/NOP family class I SAM-dependent RNA methyltransferase [Flavobacteriaceae bacterium]|nr:RsmB/NOP family class I SAM-dependent RNA methyltransferase [Flavobacteriaceae bacterium]MDG1966004.1 RsmB/NOP family class I SAM-dependent RNA methyltransferase [Flavobacteriaceae bacterium]